MPPKLDGKSQYHPGIIRIEALWLSPSTRSRAPNRPEYARLEAHVADSEAVHCIQRDGLLPRTAERMQVAAGKIATDASAEYAR